MLRGQRQEGLQSPFRAGGGSEIQTRDSKHRSEGRCRTNFNLLYRGVWRLGEVGCRAAAPINLMGITEVAFTLRPKGDEAAPQGVGGGTGGQGWRGRRDVFQAKAGPEKVQSSRS